MTDQGKTRLLEIASELEEMARGYEEKAHQLRTEAAGMRFSAMYLDRPEPRSLTMQYQTDTPKDGNIIEK